MLRRLTHSTPLSLQLLLLAALLMRGLLPMGYMPGNVSGETGLVFCTSQGASLSLQDDAAQLSGVHGDQHCPYAASIDLAAVLPRTGDPSFAVVSDARIHRVAAATDAYHPAPPQARGPPVERI